MSSPSTSAGPGSAGGSAGTAEAAGTGEAAATPWEEPFEQLLHEAVPGLPAGPVDPAADLNKAGLDSLASVQLLLELEAAFGLSVPDDDLDWRMFDTPLSLWRVVEASRPAVPGDGAVAVSGTGTGR
ncbi:acyl carrier protein [Streptomyces sp. CA-111067]|uniref:acyl carrier protein n=1 Tax=Streptomyces sp. CA-111067 TaxID=3240046 RepID=UPI003D985B0E